MITVAKYPVLKFTTKYFFVVLTLVEYFFNEAIKNNIDVSLSTNGMFLTEKWIRKYMND